MADSGVPEVGFSADSSPTEKESMDLANSRAARKKHDQIVRWTQEQYRMIRNARVGTERQWYLNLAFFFGRQHVALLRPQTSGLSTGSTRLWVPPAPYYRVRPVINRIRPTIRTELAQLTNNKPNASIVPASAEDRDLYAAMAGEQIWENIYSTHKIKSKLRRTLWWTLTCGTGFMKTYWDFDKGPVDPETGTKEGDLCVTPETPFNVLVPDLREEELEDQPFLIHAQTKSPDYVRMHFQQALNGKQVNPNSADAQDLLDESFLNLIGTQSLKQQSVLVLEVWVKPGTTPMFPNGAIFTVIGDQIVQGYEGMPYSHKQYPFAKFDHIPSGKFYATSVIEDLMPLQKEYNRTRGQIVEAKNRMAKPQLAAARGSIDASKITTEPGLVIQYTPGFDAPKPIPLSPLPTYVIQELDRIITDWNDISGQHEITKGNVPPGVTAATAISFLQERDESKMSPTFDSLEEGIEKMAQHALVYVHDYWSTEKLIKVTGPDGSFDVLTFKGSDLGNNLDIRIEAGSAMPVSKAAKQALVMDLMKMGFVEPRKGLEVMDMGGINKIYEQIQVDQRQAQRENLRMSKVTDEMIEEYEMMSQQALAQDPQAFGIDFSTGQPVGPPLMIPVNTWDNHKLHIEYHNQYRKGQAFESLPDSIKNLFEAHVMQHVAALGVETQTMDPRAAAGLPPLPPGEEGTEEGSIEGEGDPLEQEGLDPLAQENTPGPNPMPEMEGGGL